MSDPYFPSLKDIMTAEHTLNDILVPTPLMKNRNLSDKYEANIFLKQNGQKTVSKKINRIVMRFKRYLAGIAGFEPTSDGVKVR